ncbi:heavy metal-associated isoprenylated plant protein 7-like [Lycium ferocissimum]|uniref:heavy metal-associated isoprenylated plant protein 7-like n=1 Tax=Lycium ferocissimum TaxID=112874 RepID=UPI0028152337|nr:heavy metal-associated isoprenylated plant protein 7-like [Lycium ferocissimum]
MGEEEKKPTEEVKKTEEEKKEEAPPKGEKPSGDQKADEKKTEECKDAPPPPPQEIILRVYMHCEGCARKVRKSLKGFQGVEDVLTDCKTHKVVVKGEKADPMKVLERVQKKSHRQVELLSPIPKPPAEEPKKPEDVKEVVKPEEKKEEPPQVIIVVLKVHMHCEACAQEIKRRIQKMKGVESAEPDLKNSQVTVKGVFEATQLVDYVSKRTGKRAVIVKVEPEKKEEEKPKEGNEEKKAEEGEKAAKKGEEGDKKAEGGGAAAAGGGAEETAGGKEEVVQEDPKFEMRRHELYHYYPQQNYQVYPQRYAHEMYAAYPPPPQMFSDENPNACSVM